MKHGMQLEADFLLYKRKRCMPILRTKCGSSRLEAFPANSVMLVLTLTILLFRDNG